MKKEPFVTKEQIEEIVKSYPTPFHLYDEKGIRENAKAVKEAFAWNPGFREYFAVKATPNPFLLNILREYGCGADCSSMTELMLSHEIGMSGEEIMFRPSWTKDGCMDRHSDVTMELCSVVTAEMVCMFWMQKT